MNIIKLLSEICLGILKSIFKCDGRYINMFPMFYIRGVTYEAREPPIKQTGYL